MEDKLDILEVSHGDPSIEGRYHRFNKLLGKGAYKAVYKAFDTIKQVDVAWNSIDLSQMTENEKNKVFLECEMLSKLNHDNILKIRDQFRNEEKEELIFITDIIQNGSLRKYFRKRKINLKSIKQICHQILLALDYLHSDNVIHRDLKCDNIFYDSNNNKIVLGDLGLSVNFTGQSRMSIVGTPHWMAPELYNEKYNELVDIWSFGMCVLELVTNTIPYKECKNTIAVYNKVMINKEKPDILHTIKDPYIKAFINICLDFNPSKRPTAKELLSHPFLLPRYPRDYILCEKLLKGASSSSSSNATSPNKTKKRKKSKKKRKNNDDVTVHTVVSKKSFITTIKLQIYRKDDKPMAVTFDFNRTVDRAADVAQEMISELQLPSLYKKKVENAIDSAIQVENTNKTQIIGKSLTGIKVPNVKKTENTLNVPTPAKKTTTKRNKSNNTNNAKLKPKPNVNTNNSNKVKNATSPKRKPNPNTNITLNVNANTNTNATSNNKTNTVIVNKGQGTGNGNGNGNANGNTNGNMNGSVNGNPKPLSTQTNNTNTNNNVSPKTNGATQPIQSVTSPTAISPSAHTPSTHGNMNIPNNMNQGNNNLSVGTNTETNTTPKSVESGRSTMNNSMSSSCINSTSINGDNEECLRFVEIQNDLHLDDVSSYLSPGELEFDEKAQEQIVKKKDELLKEYNEFVITKNELLKLRVQSITEKELREQEISKMKQKFEKKKNEMVQQYENFINDYKDIAQYTIHSKQMELFQNFDYKTDSQFINLMNSQLAQNDKYEFENMLRDKRREMVDNYLQFYSEKVNQYLQQINNI